MFHEFRPSRGTLALTCGTKRSQLLISQLIATRLLVDLARFRPIPSAVQNHSEILPSSARSPLLTNGHGIGGPAEQPWVNTMPIGDIFLEVMYRSWDIQRERQRANLSPK